MSAYTDLDDDDQNAVDNMAKFIIAVSNKLEPITEGSSAQDVAHIDPSLTDKFHWADSPELLKLAVRVTDITKKISALSHDVRDDIAQEVADAYDTFSFDDNFKKISHTPQEQAEFLATELERMVAQGKEIPKPPSVQPKSIKPGAVGNPSGKKAQGRAS